MPSNGYNTALWIFYIPFVLAEVPSNMVISLAWVKPNLWLGGQCFILGMSLRTFLVYWSVLIWNRGSCYVSGFSAFLPWPFGCQVLDGHS